MNWLLIYDFDENMYFDTFTSPKTFIFIKIRNLNLAVVIHLLKTRLKITFSDIILLVPSWSLENFPGKLLIV